MHMDAQAYQELMQKQQLEQLKKQVLGKVLTGEALERLGRVRLANPALAEQVEIYLLTLFQQGKLGQQIPDSKLREVLAVLGQKRETSIRRV